MVKRSEKPVVVRSERVTLPSSGVGSLRDMVTPAMALIVAFWILACKNPKSRLKSRSLTFISTSALRLFSSKKTASPSVPAVPISWVRSRPKARSISKLAATLTVADTSSATRPRSAREGPRSRSKLYSGLMLKSRLNRSSGLPSSLVRTALKAEPSILDAVSSMITSSSPLKEGDRSFSSSILK